jgi:hypothetical protein
MRRPKSTDRRTVRRNFRSPAGTDRPVGAQQMETLRFDADSFNRLRPCGPLRRGSAATSYRGSGAPRPFRGKTSWRRHPVSLAPLDSLVLSDPDCGVDQGIGTRSSGRCGDPAARGLKDMRSRLPLWLTPVLLAMISLLVSAAYLSSFGPAARSRSARESVANKPSKGCLPASQARRESDQPATHATRLAVSLPRPVCAERLSVRPGWQMLSQLHTRGNEGLRARPAMSGPFVKAAVPNSDGEPVMRLAAFPSPIAAPPPNRAPRGGTVDRKSHSGPKISAPSSVTCALSRIDTQLAKLDVQWKEYDLLLRLMASRRGVFRGFLPGARVPELSFLPAFQSKIVELEIKKKALAVRYKPRSREIRTVAQEIDGVREAMKDYVAEHLVFLKKRKETLLTRRAKLEGLLKTIGPNKKAETAPYLKKTSPDRAAPPVRPQQNPVIHASVGGQPFLGMTANLAAALLSQLSSGMDDLFSELRRIGNPVPVARTGKELDHRRIASCRANGK